MQLQEKIAVILTDKNDKIYTSGQKFWNTLRKIYLII